MRSDAELLSEYRAHASSPAFAELVRRHAAMVWRTAARLLGDEHLAEDVTQATFLVLAGKPGAVGDGSRVGGWLHGIAERIARTELRSRARRSRREERVVIMRSVSGETAEMAPALVAELDAALSRLPRAVKQVVVLIYLEGRTQAESAEILGRPRGTVARQAKEGLDRLRARLGRRGVGLSSAALLGLLGQEAAIGLPSGATVALAQGGAAASTKAASMSQGMLKAMTVAKLKTAAAVLAVTAALGGGGYLAVKQVPRALARPVAAPAKGKAGKAGPEWPMLGHDAGWSNYSPDKRVKPPFRLKWATFVDSSHRTTMSVAGGRLYGRDSCLDAETGDLLWTANLGGVTTPTYYQGRLYTAKRGVSAFDAATGKKLWGKLGYGICRKSVTGLPVCDGAIYCGRFKEQNGRKTYFACALDAKNGNEIWSTPLIATPKKDKPRKGYDLRVGMGEAAVAGGRVFFTTHVPPAVFALDQKTGKELWRREGVWGQSGVSADEKHVWATDEQQGVVALDAKTGKQLWQWGGSKQHRAKTHYMSVGTSNKQPAFAYGKLFTSNYGRRYTALDAKTGKELWVTGDLKCNPWVGSCAPAVTAAGYVYSSGLYGSEFNARNYLFRLYAVSQATGKPVWKHPVGSRSCARATVAYGRVYLPGDGEYWCFEPVGADYKNDPQAPPSAPAGSLTAMAKPFGGKAGTAEAGDKPKGGKDWPMYGGSPARCGLDVKLGLPVKDVWKFQTGGKVKSSPVIADGTVYVGSDSGELFALDLATGRKKWSAKVTPHPKSKTQSKWLRSAPAVAKGIVVCGADDGVLRAFDAATGKPKWQFRTAGQIRASPAIVGDRVVFGSWDGRCYCVRLSDGKEFWRWEAEDVRMRVQAPPPVAGGRVYVSPWEGRKVFALDLGTGKPVAGYEIRGSYPKPRVGLAQGLAIYRGVIAATGLQSDGALLDAASGKLLGTSGLYGSATFPCLPAFGGGNIYQPASGPGAAKLSAALAKKRRGGKKKRRPARFKNTARNILVAGDLLVAATRKGTLEVYASPKAGSDEQPKLVWEWKSPSGAEIQTSPAAASGFIVVGSDDGHVYGFSYGKGK